MCLRSGFVSRQLTCFYSSLYEPFLLFWQKFTPPKPREREGSLVAIQSIRSAGNTSMSCKLVALVVGFGDSPVGVVFWSLREFLGLGGRGQGGRGRLLGPLNSYPIPDLFKVCSAPCCGPDTKVYFPGTRSVRESLYEYENGRDI